MSFLTISAAKVTFDASLAPIFTKHFFERIIPLSISQNFKFDMKNIKV